jgi:hypothetical protein
MAYSSLAEALTRHGGVIPVEPEDREDCPSNPLQIFHSEVEDWMWKLEADKMATAGDQARSTVQLLARGLEGAEWPYKIRLTGYPNSPAHRCCTPH